MRNIITPIAFFAILNNVLIAGGDFIDPLEPIVSIPEQEIVVIENEIKYDGFYLGTGLGHVRMNESVTASGVAITLMAGYYFNNYFGIEGRYMTTFSDLDVDSGPISILKDDTLSSYGVYAKPLYSLTNSFSFYGLAGYGKSAYEKDGVDYSETGFQWGLGAKFELANGIGLFVDYLDMYDSDDFDTLNINDVSFNATTVGATYTF